jgi:electron transfer flavoprotein alpha subunit
MSALATTAASAGTDLTSWQDVWVFVELEHGKVQQVAFELLGEGRKLADVTGSRLAGVVLGPPDATTEGACAEAIAYGADRVYLITDPVLNTYRNQPFARGLEALVRRHRPAILLLGATVLGRDLAGSVATLLGTGLTADCTELAIDAESGCLAAADGDGPAAGDVGPAAAR